jgi:hypothetical protein
MILFLALRSSIDYRTSKIASSARLITIASEFLSLIVIISFRCLQLSMLYLVVAMLVSITRSLRVTPAIVTELYIFYIFILGSLFLIFFIIASSSLISFF